MRAIIAAGGTAGHINPALAIADEIMRDQPDSEILFVGREDGMEQILVPKAGYAFMHIETHGFERRFTPAAILSNLNSIRHVFKASRKAKKLYKEFRPDVVIGCGGYVSGPVVRAAAKMGISTAIQEQNAFPGMTTKLLARVVDLVFLASADAVDRIEQKEKCIVAGNPIRDAFFHLDRDAAREQWTLDDKVCVLSFGGSLGAKVINQIAVQFMKLHAGPGRVYHIHATGQYGTKLVPDMMREYGVPDSPDIRVVEYIDDMPQCFAAADLVVSRAGAITISELAAAGRASVLIPSANVAENHQYYNALTLQNVQAALVYEEADIDPQEVAQRLWELCQDRTVLQDMGNRAKELAMPDSAGKIYRRIRELVEACKK